MEAYTLLYVKQTTNGNVLRKLKPRFCNNQEEWERVRGRRED